MVKLHAEVGQATKERYAVSYGAATSACEKRGEWQSAVKLLRDMWQAMMARDTVRYNAAFCACKT